MKKLILFFTAAFILFTGCDKNPTGALIYPGTDKYTSVDWAEEWVLYDDECKTRYEPIIRVDTSYWAHERPQDLDLECRDNPHSGSKCIRLRWDGSKNIQYDGGWETYAWTGFVFPSVSPNTGIYIPNGTYNKLKLWIKGSLSYGVLLEIKGPRNEVWRSAAQAQYPNWTEITVDFASTTEPYIGPVTTMIAISLINTRGEIPSNGGEFFIDDIRYVK